MILPEIQENWMKYRFAIYVGNIYIFSLGNTDLDAI